uniref:Uncharacterized protein n=1 Tax=Stomoxys calcitrans TaxID=35570 RepID=A0A1I8NM32_STOCA
MTSAEWELRALKALEQEEQEQQKQQHQQPQHLRKDYLALSQRSLHEPAVTPPSLKKQSQKQTSPNSKSTQLFLHTALNEPQERLPAQHPNNGTVVQSNSTNYVQLQAQQLLKLPTITEHHQHQQALMRRAKSKDSGGAGSKLKFTKVLSLSAQSLTNRLGVGGGGNSGKKSKTKSTTSPGRHALASPMYTPPPTRRCNTLHHTPTVRKTFKTLQQLERQKLEGRRVGELQVTRTLHRIAGTHKTYWKYGINSTANSIVGQHQQQQQQQLQQQHQLQQQQQLQQLQQRRQLLQGRSLTSDLESYTSDELDSEDNTARPAKILGLDEEESAASPSVLPLANDSLLDYDDSATDVGSCTVPLASDSIEMMNLMLSAAQTAVISQTSNPAPPPDITATDQLNSGLETISAAAVATGGGGGGGGGGVEAANNDMAHFPKYFTLGHRHFSSYDDDNEEEREMFSSPPDFLAGYHPPPTSMQGDEETVAYEAFHRLSRRKSFSGEKMRAHSLQRYVRPNYSDDVNEQHVDSDTGNVGNRTLSRNSRPGSSRHLSRNYMNSRSLLKASSIDVPPSASSSAIYATDFNINNANTTIITNPLIAHIKSSHSHSHSHSNSSSSANSASVTGSAVSAVSQNKPQHQQTSGGNKSLRTSQQIKQKLLTPAALFSAATSSASASTPSTFKDLNSHSLLATRSSQLQQLSPASMVCSTDDELVAYQQHLSQQFHRHHHHHHQQHQLLPADSGTQQSSLPHHHQPNHPLEPQHMGLDVCANGDLCTAGMSPLIIDDELEQHIKHCSCSCNHMGYGNSMDYQ